MQERRKYIRFNVEEGVILKPDTDPSRSLKADLVDISFSGIGVHTQDRLEVNTTAKLEIKTRLWEVPIICEGRVVHVQGARRYGRDIFRIGIEFTNIDKEAIQYVINHIQQDICEEAKRRRSF